MSYKLYFQYANGSKSHTLATGSQRDARHHLDYLLSEKEPRSLAKQIIIMYGAEIIMEACPTLEDDAIRDMARWRRAGNTQQMHNPVTASIYMPLVAREFLIKEGDGSLAAGMRKIMLDIGGPDVATAYMAEKTF
jgi:hypothetical protein